MKRSAIRSLALAASLLAGSAAVQTAGSAAVRTAGSAAVQTAVPPASLELGPELSAVRPYATGGFNYGYDGNIFDYRDAYARLEPTLLRFPGGNVGDEYDRTEASLGLLKAEASWLKVRAFIVQTRVFATRPDARNDPPAAADAARSARRLGLNVAYWEVGNEPDLYATNRADPSWTPERYCAAFRAQRAAILAVDPRARFAGPAVSKGVDEPGNRARPAGFLRRFVRACGDVVDLLTWHEYPSDGAPLDRGGLSDDAALATAAGVTERVQAFRTLLDSPETNPLGYRRRIGLGVTEYGLSWNSRRSRHLADQVGALWAAETTLRLADAGAEVATYFALQSSGFHGLLDAAGFPRPAYYAFWQLRDYRGRAVSLRASDPAVWAHAARDGDRLTVLLTNTTTAPVGLDPALAGWTPVGAKTFTEATVKAEADLVPLAVASPVMLPPRSLTRIVYKRPPAP